MATFYLFNNADFDGSYTISAGGSKTWSSSRTVAGTISKVKIVFTNTGNAKVSARLTIDGVSQGLASEATYSAGTNTITIIAENGDFNVNSSTGVKVANGSSAASIVVKGIEVTYTASSGGGSGGSGSTTPDIEEVTFSPNGGEIESGESITATYNLSYSNYTIYYTWIGRRSLSGAANTYNIMATKYASSGILSATTETVTEDTQYYYVLGFKDTNGYDHRVTDEILFTIKKAEPTALGSMSAPSFSGSNVLKASSTNFTLNNGDYTVNWKKPSSGVNNPVNSITLYNNGSPISLSASTTSYTIDNIYGEKGKISHKVIALASSGITEHNSHSPESYIYNLIINPQESCSVDNSTLTSGSATIAWDRPEIIVNDEIINNFTITYNLSYKISEDKVNWGDSVTLASNLEEASYIIEDISSLDLAGKFICFIITSNIYYNSTSLTNVTTTITDNFIKYAGEKPNQLAYINFYSKNLRNKELNSKYIYSNSEYIWESLDFKYISKGSILTVGFDELVEGYSLPGVKLTWKKGNIEKSQEFFASAAADTELFISFEENEFFDSNFWNLSNNLILTITSLGYLEQIGQTVLEEERGYFYKGSTIQTIKKPEIQNVEKILPSSKIIPVNFSNGNQEPIVDEINNIYEDLRLINIQANHPQNIDIYGYKVYGSINNNWTDDWRQTKLISDDLFKASYGGSYKEGMFIPTWEEGIDGTYIPTVNLELGILNENKNSHLTSLLNSEISEYTEKLNVNYRLTVVDIYGQESENYYAYNFYYDCRKPAIFNDILTISSPTTIETDTIIPYTDSINTIPVFNGDNLIVKFYPAINSRHYNNNQSNYIVNDDKVYLKYASDNSIVDPNYYSVYKFVKQSTGGLKSYLIDIIQPFLVNSPVIKGSEDINGEYALYYLYQLNFKLNEDNIDEIEYFQIIPFYNEENEVTRTSRVYYYDNNSNGFNICYNGNNAIFWNSRIDKPKVQVTGIERIATTKDNFGFTLPKLKLYVTDWGTTHQFIGDEKLDKDKLIEFNRLTDLTYSIKYYKENVGEDGTVTEVELPNIAWSRNYLTNSGQMMDYDTLAAEYIDYYNNFNAMKEALEGEYKAEYEGIEGTTNLPIVTSGTTLYINLPSPIKGTEESSTNFFAYLTITGNVRRVKVNADNTASFYNYTLQLADYSIYISQNKKTFMIQQGKLGINQPELSEVEESLYIIDKKYTSAENDNYPNILGLEADRTHNKINGMSGAFIGFYDDSIRNNGDRILMGSIGLGMEINDSDKAISYTPYVFYDADATGTMTALKLVPEGGDYIAVEGNIISHEKPVASIEDAGFIKINYDEFGHINGSSNVETSDIRSIGRIAYGDAEPGIEGFDPFKDGSVAEGDIYLWIQSK